MQAKRVTTLEEIGEGIMSVSSLLQFPQSFLPLFPPWLLSPTSHLAQLPFVLSFTLWSVLPSSLESVTCHSLSSSPQPKPTNTIFESSPVSARGISFLNSMLSDTHCAVKQQRTVVADILVKSHSSSLSPSELASQSVNRCKEARGKNLQQDRVRKERLKKKS